MREGKNVCMMCVRLTAGRKEWLKQDQLEEKQQVKVKVEFGRAVKVVDKVGILRDVMKLAGYALSEHQKNQRIIVASLIARHKSEISKHRATSLTHVHTLTL